MTRGEALKDIYIKSILPAVVAMLRPALSNPPV